MDFDNLFKVFAGLVILSARIYQFPNNGGCGNGYNSQNNYLKVFFQVKTKLCQNPFLQKVPGKKHTENPPYTTNYVVECELFEIHFDNAGYNGCKCAYEGQETGDDNSKSAMIIVKFLCLKQIFLFEEKSVFAVVKERTAFSSKPISDKITKDTCRRNHQKQNKQGSQIALGIYNFIGKVGTVNASYEKQTITGKEKTRKKACFGKNNK